MSKQYPGGIISKTPVTPSGPYETSTASGIWTLEQQAYWAKLGQWPTAGNPGPDAQFNYVTMLLHGDGTNGAQNNTFLDSSTNNFTITRNGNTTQGSFSPYGSNWSNYFGGGTNLSLATATALGTGNVTVEFWFYPTDISATYYGLYDGRSAAGTNTGFGIFQYGQTIEIFGNGLKVSTAASAFTGNTWTHFAVVRTSGTCQIYINGVASGSSASYSDNFTSTIRTIASNVTTANVYTGYISNLREVTSALYSGTFTPSTTPLTAVSGTTLLTCQSNRFIDNSANNYAITITTITTGTPSVQRFNPFGASTAYSTSVIGGSGYFDGAGDNLSVAANSSNIGTGDFNITFWMYLPTVPNNGVPATNAYNAASFTNGWYFYTGVGTDISFGVGDATGASAVGGTASGINAWHYIEATRSGSTLSLYIDGVLAQSKTNTNNGTVSGNITRIGARYDGGGNPIAQYITDFKVVVGTAGNTSNYTPPTAPASATGSTLLLSMQNGAIFDNAMMNDLETVGNAQISTSVVKYGTGSLAFDGTGDYLVSAPSPVNILGGGDFTIEFWLYPSNTLSGYRALVASENYSAVTGGWSLYQNGTAIELWPSPGSSEIFNATSAITASTWQHLAVCRASGTLRLFINGTQAISVSNSTSFTGQQIWIGDNNAGSYFFNGYIDDLRITKGYARYTANFTPPTSAFSNFGPNT